MKIFTAVLAMACLMMACYLHIYADDDSDSVFYMGLAIFNWITSTSPDNKNKAQ